MDTLRIHVPISRASRQSTSAVWLRSKFHFLLSISATLIFKAHFVGPNRADGERGIFSSSGCGPLVVHYHLEQLAYHRTLLSAAIRRFLSPGIVSTCTQNARSSRGVLRRLDIASVIRFCRQIRHWRRQNFARSGIRICREADTSRLFFYCRNPLLLQRTALGLHDFYLQLEGFSSEMARRHSVRRRSEEMKESSRASDVNHEAFYFPLSPCGRGWSEPKARTG